MNDLREPMEHAALDWIIRMDDPDFDGWDDWEAWLAETPVHGEIYWKLAAEQAELSERLSRVAPDAHARGAARPSRRKRPSWALFGAAAAVVLAMVGGALVLNRPEAIQSLRTNNSERRDLTLADGSRVHLDAGTHLEVSADGRSVTMVSGRALFEVAPDDRAFTVTVGKARIVDLGTAFDVTRLNDGLRVDVSRGRVRYEAEGRREELGAGEGLTADSDGLRRRNLEPDDVSSWRQDRLSYRAEPLAIVAQDLARALGRPVSVDPSLRTRRFTGSIMTSVPAGDLKTRLETLLDVRITEERSGWRLQAPAPE